MKKAVYFLALLLLAQCKMSENKQEMGNVIEIDVSQKYSEKEFFLQDIAKVEYIPLETNDNTLIGSYPQVVYISDSYIIIKVLSTSDVFIFDGKGKSKFNFNNKGQSGTEYNNLSCVAFDEKSKEIFVADRYSANPKFLVYAEDGQFKRSLPFPPNLIPRDIYNFDDEALLVYDEFGLNQDNYSKNPYLLLSKIDGSVVDTLDIHLPERVSNRIIIPIDIDGQSGVMPITLSIPISRSFGDNFLISDWSTDTIYKLTPKREFLPMIVRKPSVHKSEPKIVVSNELVTDRFIFLYKAVLDFEMAKQSRTFPTISLIYDFETKQLNEYKLINKDYEERGFSGFGNAITPKNTGVYILEAHRLFEADGAGKLKGELKELLKMLDEDDNPIIVKVKF